MDVLSLVLVAVVSVLVTLAGIGVYLMVVECWKDREDQEIKQRLEQLERHYVPCLKCVPEGRLCPYHTAELIAELKGEVAV